MLQPTPPGLQRAIVDDVNWMAGPLAQRDVRKNFSLESVFGLRRYQRRALAAPFQESIRRWKDDERAAGISVWRIDGEDPTKGFVKQKLWQVGATLRIK